MIASYSNNFIFLRTRKTGGTSAELVLSSWCEDSDVCTRLSPEEELLRKEFGGLRPRRSHNGQRVYHHMPAIEVRHIFADLWDDAFKFAIERHPYEKVVSRVFWNIGRRGGDPSSEFESELREVLQSNIFVDREVYTIDGQIAVDEIVHYDRFWERMATLAVELGKNLPAPLPNAKGAYRTNKRPAHQILTESQKRRIRCVAEFEFSTLGFSP